MKLKTSNRFTYIPKKSIIANTPERSANFLMTEIFNPVEACEQEEFWVLLLNARNVITYAQMVHRGTGDKVEVYARDIFRLAVRQNAQGIIVAHNHPSLDNQPSTDDEITTQHICKAGKLLGIPVCDHLIIGGTKSWVSIRETHAELFSNI